MRIILFFLLLFPPFNLQAAEEIVYYYDGEKKWSYIHMNIQGWNIYIEKSLRKNKKLFLDIKSQLNKDLSNICKLIPSIPLSFLKTVNIWASNENLYPFRPNELGVIPFHRSKSWLIEHGLNPAMEGGVHIINPNKVFYHHKVFEWQPMIFLHELSHAFHVNYLGKDNMTIINAYNNSVKNNLYKKIPSRNNPNLQVEAYAKTNKFEYFAELTETYFGTNDFFPKNKKELKKYDPKGFEMIELIWKIKK